MTRDLQSLNHAGFIELAASAPLAPCYPRERERSKSKKELGLSVAGEASPVENQGQDRASAEGQSVEDFETFRARKIAELEKEAS